MKIFNPAVGEIQKEKKIPEGEEPVSFRALAEETTLHGISKAANGNYSFMRR